MVVTESPLQEHRAPAAWHTHTTRSRRARRHPYTFAIYGRSPLQATLQRKKSAPARRRHGAGALSARPDAIPSACHARRARGACARAPRSVSEGTTRTPEHPTPADPARKCRPPDMPWQRSKRTLLKVIILGDSGVGYVAPWRSAGAAPHSFVLVCDASADSGRPAPHAQQNVAHEPVREQEVQQSV